jgi:hypothetical protein
MRKTITLIIALTNLLLLTNAQISDTFIVTPNDVAFKQNEGYDEIAVSECAFTNEIGYPQLPVKSCHSFCLIIQQ